MSLLALRNRAVREGWVNDDRYAAEIARFLSPGKDIQQQYGDEVYDRFLYAYGNPNRVRVTEVYAGSAAELVGIEIGDIILSYAATNIYSMADLRSATAQGESGEPVLVVAQRNGLAHYFNVPRGPLGIGMGTLRQLPQPPGE
jgi:S1-C subfamily serine protease